MKTVKQLLYFVFSILILFSCGKKQESIEQVSDLIEITNQQFATDTMRLGIIETKSFESIVKCNGIIVPKPNGMAEVNAPISGIIKSIHCHNGQFVQKNQTLFQISGNEIIDIQKDFAEASANFKRFKNEFERVKSLYNEKVTSEKEFVMAESEFKTSVAKYNGLKLKLESIGFPASKIENGEFFSSYSLKSPINGYISNLKVNIGAYVDQHSSLVEVTNPAMFQVQLSVFATDVANLRIGQQVRIKSVNSKNEQIGIISSVGVSVDNNTKSVECYASITDKEFLNPIANEFVESEIITSTEVVNALPTDAIIKTETGNVILILEKQEKNSYFFKPLEIKIGKQNNGFTEIPGEVIKNKILIKGIYNISL